MSDKFNKELSELYKTIATKQKNTKGVTDKFDRPENANFRGKVGYNDTGIPLTPKAAKKQRNNRAGYHYPHHLQVINENRKKAAMDRHGITDPDNPYNLKKKKVSAQPAVRSNRSSYWSLPMAPSPRKRSITITLVIQLHHQNQLHIFYLMNLNLGNLCINLLVNFLK